MWTSLELFFDDTIHELVVERLTASDSVADVAKWESLTTSMDLVMQNMKSFTSEIIASTSQRQEQLEKKLVVVANKQDKIDTQLQFLVAKQDAMGFDIKAIMDILKKIPYILGLVPFIILYCYLL